GLTPAQTCEPEWANAPEVLIAEDNPDMRSLLATLIGREFRVRTARNGREALEKLQEHLPDLLLSDVMMPEMSGLELCREVKQNPATRTLPVVLVTSKAERDMKIEGLELGADDYVTKPFHPRELMARVRSLVRVVGLQKQLSRRNASLESALDELKQAEVQLVQSERLAAVGELAAGIAHEVNNPVNFALNSARTLEAAVQDFRAVVGASDPGVPPASQPSANSVDEIASDVVELAEIIREGLSRTASLVGDLRDFSSPGRLGAQVPGVQVEKGLRSTLQLVRHDLEKRGADVHVSIEEGLPSIIGDLSGLNQVFLNLLKNAGEALGPAGGRVDLSLARHGEELIVEVSDDGAGIRSDHLNRLFEPFFTTKETGEGTGLGLSISRRIVAAHGGRIEVASAAGEGTRFSVHLPISREEGGKTVSGSEGPARADG
ncbi:response regulator, partial [Myxococcota bacterium]|nr:response regulator [Myxococcota bacterium]